MTRSLEIASGRLAPESISGGPLAGFRNKIINGDFDIWQRGTSFTTSGYGADRMVVLERAGHTVTADRQDFTLGQTDVPGNPKYYYRTVLSGGSGATAEGGFYQNIEDVRTLSGKSVTLTFYAKADSAKDIAIEFGQNFGSGGSPSASLLGGDITVTTVSLTTSWQRYNVQVTLPSIAGKTLGTNLNSRLFLLFWYSAGTDRNTRSNSLGIQSGTFDIAHISLVEGDATLENDPFDPRPIGQELALCQRYYEEVETLLITSAWPSSYNQIFWKVPKRGMPTLSLNANSGTGGAFTPDYSLGAGVSSAFQNVANSTNTGATVMADAEL